MVRSKWKGVYLGRRDYIMQSGFLWDRALPICGSHVGKEIKVHNGFEVKNVFVQENMVGYKYGEFSFTRRM